MTIRKPSIGSISHGTLRNVDLLGSFEYELRRIADKYEHIVLADKAKDREDVLLSEPDKEDETDSELVNDLMDALNEYALPYTHFGAHDGDGSDFGFWLDTDAIDELQKFNDLAGVPEGIEDNYVVVNDHGNVSVYAADGTLIWGCV